MARRHLGFEVDEWRAMPWWKSRLYSDGLVWEFVPAGEQSEDVDLMDLGFNVTPIDRFG